MTLRRVDREQWRESSKRWSVDNRSLWADWVHSDPASVAVEVSVDESGTAAVGVVRAAVEWRRKKFSEIAFVLRPAVVDRHSDQ